MEKNDKTYRENYIFRVFVWIFKLQSVKSKLVRVILVSEIKADPVKNIKSYRIRIQQERPGSVLDPDLDQALFY